MLTSTQKNQPVNSILRVDMIVDGERKEKGDEVPLSHRDFVYLSQHSRVAEATPENVAAVKAEIKAAAEAAERAKQPTEADILRREVAELKAELAKKGK